MGCCQPSVLTDVGETALVPTVVHGHKKTASDEIRFKTSDFLHHTKGVLAQQYQLNEKLGDGSYGVVYSATHIVSNERRAIKSISKVKVPEGQVEEILSEVHILLQLDHPNILRVIEVIEDDGYFHIISELCTGGELFERIIKQRSFSEDVAARYMKQLLSAIAYCHEHHIVHRDLKPENLLLENESEDALLKLIDFGTSIKIDPGSALRNVMGTPYYIAPEILLESQYDEKCDVWSCGVILYVLLSGTPPFPGKSDADILNRVKLGVFSFARPEWNKVSQEAKNFISRILVFNPKHRPSARDLISDPWLNRSPNGSSLLDKDLLENMKNFHGSYKLRQAAFQYIANYLTTVEETEVLRKMFISMDKNQDGQLSREELEQGFSEAGLITELNVDEIMHACDADGNGFIDYSEFLTAGINWKQTLNNQRLQAAFNAFDLDKSGFITADEIKKMLGGTNSVSGDEIWASILEEADENGDGMIDLQEFKNMLLRKSAAGLFGSPERPCAGT